MSQSIRDDIPFTKQDEFIIAENLSLLGITLVPWSRCSIGGVLCIWIGGFEKSTPETKVI